jgi:2-amino-4-hydroxy-6-hydroxymethyldihydropteridine diphosphokinase
MALLEQGTSQAAFIGLGANLGDCGAALAQALHTLQRLDGIEVAAVSSLYSSAPVDATGPDYLNAVAQLQTTLTPLALLRALQAVEDQAGRVRPYRNAPRTLDLDVLTYGDLRSDDAVLTLPHPRMAQRAFVLRPLAEIAPTRVTPDQLQAVADQRIALSQGLDWWQVP